MIDLAFLQRLIETIENSEIDSIEISRWATKIRISKSPTVVGGIAGNAFGPAPVSYRVDAGPAAAPAGAEPKQPEPQPAVTPQADTANLVDVTSPMVGTFYRAPAPDADPYVDIGDRVKVGQTLCILEAMKLMNELEAEVSGVIKEIAMENAEPVEYGQVLFRILPD
ncbi:MAG: acetyl-CoA carboxylase biotin carboxyl carrier protein [Gemmatimonadales bacterium]|jgi:acetyl-CoA carboxylase biotin carboxyl carrier protein